MSKLAPDLFQLRFQALVELGRARLQPLAPAWTDHNAHDPGITLMELLAWVTEAQLYALSRTRRDERTAYAALLGVTPAGASPARGVIWPDRLDPQSPAKTFTRSTVIESDAVASIADDGGTVFRPQQRVLWAPGRIHTMATRSSDGRTVVHTAVNQRGGAVFLPFGERAGRRDVLSITFECNDPAGLFGVDRRKARGAPWAIGVRAATPPTPATDNVTQQDDWRPSVQATLVTDSERIALEVVSDSSHGMLTTGVLLIGLDNVLSSPTRFTLELRSPEGFARPPHVLQIEPNVVPIVQGRAVFRELHITPDLATNWSFELAEPGLCFAGGEAPLLLEVVEAGGVRVWSVRDDLSAYGPEDLVYHLDTRSGRVTFGNGVNGRMPPGQSQVLVSYAVCDAERGHVARNRRWRVSGFPSALGVNLDPVDGGAAPLGWSDQRRIARRRARQEHALVSAQDVVSAALALPRLEVTRAWVPAQDDTKPRMGVVKLLAMHRRQVGLEQTQPESSRWLAAVRDSLLPRMPLGTRLIVAAPRYIHFSVYATVEPQPGCDPAVVLAKITDELRNRFALTGSSARKPGLPVTQRDVIAWLRGVVGIRRVTALRLVRADGRTAEEIGIAQDSLPQLDLTKSTIEVKRSGPEAQP